MRCLACNRIIPNGSAFCNRCGAPQSPDAVPAPAPFAETAPARNKKNRTRGNGTGYVYKRGKTWTAYAPKTYVVVDGVTKRRSPASKGGFKTKAEALAYIPTLMNKRSSAPTLEYYWNLYEKSDLPKLSENRQQKYLLAYKRIQPIVKRPIDTLTINDLRQIVSSTVSAFGPASTMKNLLSNLYKLAGAEQTANPSLPSYIVLPEYVAEEPVPFSKEEIQKIWQAYESGFSFAGYFLVMIYSGMMPGELLKLSPSNIHYDTNEITGIGLKTKVRRTHSIVFPDFIKPVLKHLVSLSPASERLVPCCDRTFRNRFSEACETMGIRTLTPYACRHTTATALSLDQSVAPAVIQRVMRHAAFSTTQHYIHTPPSAAVSAVNRLQEPPSVSATAEDERR